MPLILFSQAINQSHAFLPTLCEQLLYSSFFPPQFDRPISSSENFHQHRQMFLTIKLMNAFFKEMLKQFKKTLMINSNKY